MAERMNNKYQRLFEIRVLHHYWLDEGSTMFDSLPKNAKERALLPDPKPPTQEGRLVSYDVRSLLSITPTTTTMQILKGDRGVYKETNLGCIVAVHEGAVISSDTLFEFVITVKNTAFFNYTSLTLRPQKIYEFFLQSQQLNPQDPPPEIKSYRYKENVPVLSNLTGATRILGGEKRLFLSQKFAEFQATDLVESLIVSGNDLKQLTSDQSDTNVMPLGAQDESPVFVHQADVPPIEPPNGLTAVPVKGILLSDDVPDNVFALIQLSPLRNDDDDFSFIDNRGHAKTANPVFEIRFKNRSTIWQYLKKDTMEEASKEPNPLPLTYFGNAGNKQKPSADLVDASRSGDKITELISKVFI